MTRIPSRAVGLTWILLPFLLDTAVLLPSARAADDQLAQLRAERKKLAHRERGIIYSNDGCDACFEATEPTAENLLKQRAIPHLTDHVGSVFYSTTFSLGLYWHHAAVPGVDLYTQPHVKTGRNIVGGLIAKGTDPLEIMVDFYHEHDRELFSNVRMNDIHDAGYYRYGNIPKWKLTHPEWLFGAIRRDPEAAAKVLAERRFDPYRRYFDPELSRYVVDKRPPATEGWSGADFSVPEVREMVFRVLEDICRRYDADGIQLDFLRHPPYFKSVAWGEEITQEQTDVMTGLVRRIREMTEREGLRRGRPILVSVRILGSVAMNEAQGLDISRWLEKDLIDLMVVGWVQEAPLKPMVELSRQYHVPVYMHMHRNRGGVRGSLEGQRARAMMAYADGADGVYLFNYFDPMWLPLFSELGDRQQLQRLDKVYCTMPMGSYGLLARFVKNAVPLIGVPTLSPAHPETLKPGGKYVIDHFPVGDDVFWGRDQSVVPDLTLRIQATNLERANQFSITMNGQKLTDGELQGDWLEFHLAPELVRQGNNRFAIALDDESGKPCELRDFQLHVKYRKQGEK